ncbi:MAG: YggS family pyridoxal phosphate-dependent enzyme, partial [Thermoguttaceae bacterium]|nr:YggS family pyridoxal phosphate-dependent enzyme [Thermoguttaceae bacterium]
MEQDRIDEKVAGRFLEVRQQIAEAAKRSGRSENAVRLVAVTKYADCESGIVQAFLKTGCRDFGESRPQRLLEKMDFFGPEQVSGPPLRWHMIGPLQRNKIRRILNRVALI